MSHEIAHALDLGATEAQICHLAAIYQELAELSASPTNLAALQCRLRLEVAELQVASQSTPPRAPISAHAHPALEPCACARWSQTTKAFIFCENLVESPDSLMCHACNTGAVPCECPCNKCRRDEDEVRVVPRECHTPIIESADAPGHADLWHRMSGRSRRRMMKRRMRMLMRIRIRLWMRKRMRMRMRMRLQWPSTGATSVSPSALFSMYSL